MNTNNNFIFTTISVYKNIPLALDKHLKKLEIDYKNYFKKYLDLKNFKIPSFEDNIGCFRFNIYAYLSGKIETKISPYERSAKAATLLKISKPIDIQSKFKINPSNRLNKLKKIQAQSYSDGIFIDDNKNILETCFCNLFWIKDKTLYTPSKELNLYFGVTIELVIEYAKKLNYQIKQIKENDFSNLTSSHVYMCNSMKGVICVEKVDQHNLLIDQKFANDFNKHYLSDSFSAQVSKSFSSMSSL